MIQRTGLALGFALAFLALAASAGYARDTELSAQARKCLRCHDKEKIEVTFQDGESVSARVLPDAFKVSRFN